jgi:hypothetical protein
MAFALANIFNAKFSFQREQSLIISPDGLLFYPQISAHLREDEQGCEFSLSIL